jgi:tRNA A-37 threonylcarbamoyl transferase component Bud32
VNPERWQQLKRIFEEAAEKDTSTRTAYLDDVCRSDAALRRDVEALLDSHGQDGFLEKPAYQEVAELFVSDPGDLLIEKTLGPYTITNRIGQGGMGIVYLARDIRLDRLVAIKALAPKYTRDPQQRERLKREARAAARLSHPGVATVYSLEEFGDNLYIVSEYVSGRTLHQVMSGEPAPLSLFLDVALQICRALTAAHEQGIIHRDLKPENIARTENGIIKILDFGLARVVPRSSIVSDVRLTRSGMFLGTPAYASPEQLLGTEIDFRTDLFSFGVLLYEMASGKHPFGAADSVSTIARILEGEAADLAAINPEYPPEVDRIVRRCLNKKPEDRYQSTRHLLADLERVSDRFAAKNKVAPAKADADTRENRKLAPLWWWQFHQACAGFGYYGMLYPMWRVKQWIGGVEGSALFFPVLIAVGVAANLRLHLWFTSRFYVSELQEQRRKTSRWIRWADWLFVIMLATSAVRIHTIHAIIATLLMSVAIGSLVAFSLIEPTTTKAALEKN